MLTIDMKIELAFKIHGNTVKHVPCGNTFFKICGIVYQGIIHDSFMIAEKEACS